jgi:hypothetical protein
VGEKFDLTFEIKTTVKIFPSEYVNINYNAVKGE